MEERLKASRRTKFSKSTVRKTNSALGHRSTSNSSNIRTSSLGLSTKVNAKVSTKQLGYLTSGQAVPCMLARNLDLKSFLVIFSVGLVQVLGNIGLRTPFMNEDKR